MARGLFISLDGLDGTGKSTQCRLFVRWLCSCGHAVTACTDPGGTVLGLKIRALLLDRRQEMTGRCEALLVIAAGQSMEVVHERICQEVARVLASGSRA